LHHARIGKKRTQNKKPKDFLLLTFFHWIAKIVNPFFE